jgi:hypothetical protein
VLVFEEQWINYVKNEYSLKDGSVPYIKRR